MIISMNNGRHFIEVTCTHFLLVRYEGIAIFRDVYKRQVFIPFAGVTQTWDDYTAKTAAVLAPLGVSVTGIHSEMCIRDRA